MTDFEITLPRQLRRASTATDLAGWMTVLAGCSLPTLSPWWIALIPAGCALVAASWRLSRWAAQARAMAMDLRIARCDHD